MQVPTYRQACTVLDLPDFTASLVLQGSTWRQPDSAFQPLKVCFAVETRSDPCLQRLASATATCDNYLLMINY